MSETVRRIRAPLDVRFWRKVSRGYPDPCWPWLAARNACGYGVIRETPGLPMRLAHRVAYQLCVGAIPDGMHVLHRCDRPECVNPGHLWLGTHQDNMRDMASKHRANGEPAPPGEDHPMAKLTDAAVRSIRARYKRRVVTQKMLAMEHGVCRELIGQIVRRDVWKHL